MSIEVVTEFLSSATVRVIAYVYDSNGNLVDPTAVTINIYDPDGTLQAGMPAAMAKVAIGVYDYYYHKGVGEAAMDTGRWRGEVIVADGTGASTVYSTGSFSFKVR